MLLNNVVRAEESVVKQLCGSLILSTLAFDPHSIVLTVSEVALAELQSEPTVS